MAATVEWQGLDTLGAIIRDIPTHAMATTNAALLELADDIFAQSQIEVPVRHGFLRASGHISYSDDEVIISYGGSSAGYALWVHENLQAHHIAPTKAKYLEDPVNAKMSTLEDKIEAHVDAVIVGQYPQQPSMAQGGAMSQAVRAHRPKSRGRPRAMTHAEIRQALHAISHGEQQMVRAGNLRTFGEMI